MAPRTGRPPSENPARNVTSVRLPDDSHAACVAAAEKAGLTLGAWMRREVEKAAKRQR